MISEMFKILVTQTMFYLNVNDTINLSNVSTFFSIRTKKLLKSYMNDVKMTKYYYPQDITYCRYCLEGKGTYWMRNILQDFYFNRNPNGTYSVIFNQILCEDLDFDLRVKQYFQRINYY